MTGLPPSANGASSLHLRWELASRYSEVSVGLTVQQPPRVERLYFWALQVDLVDGRGAPAGGAHLGLQWHPGHPGSTAVNWGGYHAGGGELAGSASPLPSATANANTRDYRWEPRRPYRLAVSPAPVAVDAGPGGTPPGTTAWRATVTDTLSGHTTHVRDLFIPGEAISNVLVWSEVFARCDDPSTTVRWTDPAAVGTNGRPSRPARAVVNYQSHGDGGCANTNSAPVGAPAAGIAQTTNCERTMPQSSVLPWPS